jgi:ribosomal protein L7/L12
MADKKEIMSALRELKEKRLLSSEVDKLMEPYVGAAFDLRLDFVSASRSFGSQKDQLYNDGQKVLCTAEKWDVECDILFSPEDNDLVESLEVGQDFQVTVRFIEYDVLYQRVIFGKVGAKLELLEEESDSNEAVSSNESVPANDGVDEPKHTTIEDKLEESNDIPLAEEEVTENIVEDVEVESWKPESVIPSEPDEVVSEEVESEFTSFEGLLFDVGIDEEPSNKIGTIVALRNVISGLSLADAKALIEDTPFVIKSQCTEKEAKEIQNKFRKAGAHAFYASSDVWDDIIASKTTSKASDIAPPLPNVSNVPTFGADDNSVQDESYSTVTAESGSEEKGNNCGAGCVSLFFYGLGALTTLAGCTGSEGGMAFFGLIMIGIGYGVQKASGTK